MITRPILLGIFIIAVISYAAVTAQDRPDLPQIVVLSVSFPDDQMQAFEEGLDTLGYIKGTSINIDYRSAQGRIDKLEAFAEQAVSLKPRVIVTVGSKSARAAQNVTRDIPIIAVTGDMGPAGADLVRNYARPEGNVTGLSLFQIELMPKRLEMLLELAPQIRRLNVFVSAPMNPTVVTALSVLTSFAKDKDIDINVIEIARVEDVESELEKLHPSAEEGLMIRASPVFDARPTEIGQLTAKHQIITMLPWKQYVHAGGLISYSPDIIASWRRVGYYVDKILRGAKPVDLPIEQPTQYELVINIGTAEALGLKIPTSLLVSANEIVE